MRLPYIAVLAGAVLFIGTMAYGDVVSPPWVTVWVDNWSHTYQAQSVGADLWYLQLDNVQTPSGDSFSLSATSYCDPSITYSFNATDFGAPSAFSFVFSSPIILGPGPTTTYASLGLTMTDSPATYDGLTVTPLPPPAGIPVGAGVPKLAVATVNNGGPSVNLGVDLGPAQVVPGGPGTVVTSFSAGFIPGPPGPWTNLRVDVNFGLSGGGDALGGSGSVVIDTVPSAPVPLPPAEWAGLATLAGMGLFRFLRRKV
jgi:hypothetical protein